MIARIPLDIVVTATGQRTGDVLVAVMASDLDALEQRIERTANEGRNFQPHLSDDEAAAVERFAASLLGRSPE